MTEKRPHLYCKKGLNAVILEEGKRYEIIWEDNDDIALKDEMGEVNHFSKYKDEKDYFGNYFEYVK